MQWVSTWMTYMATDTKERKQLSMSKPIPLTESKPTRLARFGTARWKSKHPSEPHDAHHLAHSEIYHIELCIKFSKSLRFFSARALALATCRIDKVSPFRQS